MMFRERILSQVNVILQSVESIVSQLQEVCQYPNDQEQFWWDCQDVQSQCQSRSPDEDFENFSKLSQIFPKYAKLCYSTLRKVSNISIKRKS